MADELSFAELVEALRRGDPQAVGELERRFGADLRRVVRRSLRRRVMNWADSAEFCQNVWLRLLQRRITADFRTPENLMAYLGTMAQNEVAAIQRAEAAPARDRQRLDPTPCEEHEVLSDDPEPVARILDWELVAEIRARLGDVFCQVHDLRCAGLEWAQIGVQLESAADALRKRYERAILRLRRDLGIG